MKGCCLLVGVTVVAGLLNCAHAQESAPERTIDSQIRAVLQAQQDAWNRGDIDAFMNGYARGDATTFVSGDGIIRGWETVRQRYHAKYSDRATMGKLTFSGIEIVPLSKDAALVDGSWRLERANDQPHGRTTLLFRLTNDGWRIVHDHSSAATPPPP
jgi:uncharacterized protein (TIGR02246 family)